MDRLNCISFRGKQCNQKKLQNVLSKLGLKINTIDDNRLTQKLISDQTDVNLFVFDDPGKHCESTYHVIYEALQRNFLTTNLCLSFTQPKKSCDDFFSHFDDLLFWPCETQELQLRINRYQIRFKKSKPTLEQRLFDEFALLNLIGQSPIFIRILEFIKRLASCDASVLIEGETGTGKENVARAIHYLSKRSDHSFVPINCGTIPDNLLEGELFGHEKGAFTDAKTRQAGLVEIANNGTLFLDEVDCLSPKAQVALLRFLQTQEYRALGSHRTHKANIRVLAATNANLRNNIDNGLFREDLYFRLNVLNITLPALRERKSDIPLIARKFIADFAMKYNSSPKKLTFKTIDWLMKQQWRGNVREMENVLMREFLLTDAPFINIEIDSRFPSRHEDSFLSSETSADTELKFQEAKALVIQEFEESYIRKILSKTNGNITKAAAIAGKDRRAIGKLLKEYNIDKSSLHSIRTA